MKLEHRRQHVVNPTRFLLRLFRYAIVSGILIVFSLGLGVFGYHFFGLLDWLTSFHMAAMILTGMGPVAELKTQGGVLFSSFYALYSGIAFLSTSAVFLTPVIHRVLHILHVDVDSSDENKMNNQM